MGRPWRHWARTSRGASRAERNPGRPPASHVRNGWDVGVVGAGPAGATTALLLARAGLSVVLVDRTRFPRDKPCAEYLSPATTEILERLGGNLLDAVEGVPHAKLSGMKVVAPDGTAMCGRFRAGPRPYSFALPRTAFDPLLLSAAARAGAVVRERMTVEDLVWDRGAVAGFVARRLGLIRHSPPERIAFAAHVADVQGMDGVGELHVSDRGYVGLGPVGGGITTVALVLPLRQVRASGRDYRREFFAELERFPGLAGRFDPRRLVRQVLATGPFAQWARTAVVPGALLVGDAADFFDPFTGQGIHSAMRGAELAAQALVPVLATSRGPVAVEALRPYARARRRTFRGKWLLERLIGLGVGSPALTNRVVTRLAQRPELSDLLVGATGNIVPAARVLAAGVLARLLW